MGKNRSIDDLRSAHLHFVKSVEAPIQDMPQHYRDEKAVLDAVFAEIEAVSRSRTFVGVQKKTDVAMCRDWTARATDALVRTRHFLLATTPENVREYFPEPGGPAARMIDKLHTIAKALTVSEHFEHAHLGAFKTEFEALKTEGEAIFGAASVSLTEQKTEVEKLKELRARWENQYQRLKLLFHGYFYGTSTDHMKFFGGKRFGKNVTGRNGSEELEATASPTAAS